MFALFLGCFGVAIALCLLASCWPTKRRRLNRKNNLRLGQRSNDQWDGRIDVDSGGLDLNAVNTQRHSSISVDESERDIRLSTVAAETERLLRRITDNKSLAREIVDVIGKLGRPSCLQAVRESARMSGLVVESCGEQYDASPCPGFTITPDHACSLDKIDLCNIDPSLAKVAFTLLWSLEGCCALEVIDD